ncbi:hypothetical protein [Thermosynechococcus sp.]|uniref:hypothetical protein n=1 Tax=Thermosynechococcus sp. TaxID=2814275 RepID=UPI003918E1E8
MNWLPKNLFFAVLAIANTGNILLDFKVRAKQWQQRATGQDEFHLSPLNSLELNSSIQFDAH